MAIGIKRSTTPPPRLSFSSPNKSAVESDGQPSETKGRSYPYFSYSNFINSPLIGNDFGDEVLAQDTGHKICSAVDKYNKDNDTEIKVTYKNKFFTLSNTSEMNTTSIKNIFSKPDEPFLYWYPNVVGDRDDLGDVTFSLSLNNPVAPRTPPMVVEEPHLERVKTTEKPPAKEID